MEDRSRICFLGRPHTVQGKPKLVLRGCNFLSFLTASSFKPV